MKTIAETTEFEFKGETWAISHTSKGMHRVYDAEGDEAFTLSAPFGSLPCTCLIELLNERVAAFNRGKDCGRSQLQDELHDLLGTRDQFTYLRLSVETLARQVYGS